MAIKLSNKARAIKSSPTLVVFSKAKKMIAEGIDVINFGVGEPDFNTPEYIKKAAIKAINENFTKYTVSPGIPELRQAIVKKFKDDNNLDYSINNIMVNPGAKSTIATVLMAICDPKDEVIIPTPYWVSYPAQVDLADGTPVILETDETENFKVTPEKLEEKILELSNPKVLILTTPSNPSGMVYTKSELKGIADVCVKYNILVISDEIYEKLVYGDTKHYSIAQVSEDIKNLTIIVNGVSKAYAMTGWRLGYAAASEDIIQKSVKIQSHTASCVNSIAQKAAIAALTINDGSIDNMVKEFENRCKFLVDELNKINNVTCVKPDGAFYALPNISWYIENNKKGITNSVELCTFLLEKYHIAVVPGSAFGVENYLRFSYANSMENLQKGLKRFVKGLDELMMS